MTWSDLLLFAARKAPVRAIRQSAFRKYCRRNAQRSVDVDCQGGFSMRTIIGDSVDNNIAVYGIFEVGTSHVIEALGRQSASFVDVGCNIGYYACLFAAQNPNKRLLAVDPNPVMTERTQANLERNRHQNFQVLNIGIGSEAGTLELHVPRDRHSLSSFAYVPKKGGPSDTIQAEIRPLQALLDEEKLEDVLIKIDTEGFEGEVFKGLTQEGAQRIRFMLFELASANLEQAGSSPAEIFGLEVLEAFDAYLIQDEEGGYIEPVPKENLTHGGRINANVLLVRDDDATREALGKSGVRQR